MTRRELMKFGDAKKRAEDEWNELQQSKKRTSLLYLLRNSLMETEHELRPFAP